MSVDALAAVQPVTYPARPINGGALELAPPKSGNWLYEPKYNGWRALVHAPTGTMFNRYGGPLSIASEFGQALKRLREVALVVNGAAEWFDCEALARRHPLGRGTLLVFDYIGPEPLSRRKAALSEVLPPHDYMQPPLPQELYAVAAHLPASKAPQVLYRELKQMNARWGCVFYEGVVAKRTGDAYPVQLRSTSQEFSGWVKHRWAY
jgi:ATP-dependent DNA ligase